MYDMITITLEFCVSVADASGLVFINDVVVDTQSTSTTALQHTLQHNRSRLLKTFILDRDFYQQL